ncbi:MAG: sulfotransferase [Proteobacteria bacterium]|nr:MAG: sulfotransferase [Pseudomonadota bacterium]
MDSPSLPRRTRIYQNHHFDSTRWDYFATRPDDIVIATSYKAGTTWTQSIVAHLLFEDGLPAPLAELSPWLDMRVFPLEVILNGLAAQPHRRFIKTHLPLDGLPWDPERKFVYVARDGRDVFMSLWNHHSNFTDEALQIFNSVPGRVGDELPRAPADLHALWRDWVSRGWFAWESDGWPFWSHLYNVQSWWDFRHLPNILLVHYADLREDTEREVRRIARFLGIEVPEARWPALLKNVSLTSMREQGELYAPGGGQFWKGGAKTFLHQGTNGRWRDVLTPDELAQYDAACARTLTPDCRAWLEHGARALAREKIEPGLESVP